MAHMFRQYPEHLSLDVNSDNLKAISFYKRTGLAVTKTYTTNNRVEFLQFETP